MKKCNTRFKMAVLVALSALSAPLLRAQPSIPQPSPLEGAPKVSASVQKKNVLLEEFTGWGCGNCPAAAALIEEIRKTPAAGGFFVLAYHAGHYAETPGNIPAIADLQTAYGDSLHKVLKINSYPCGAINRYDHLQNGKPGMSRSEWIKTIKKEVQQDAPVNLYIEAEVDYQTRVLNVHVEYLFTDEPQGEYYLHVALSQDRIEGRQNQASEDYLHNHVFRDYFTGQWGVTLPAAQKNQAYEWNYTVSLPDSMRNRDINLRHIALTAFISRYQTEVLNAAACHPRITQLSEPAGVEITAEKLRGNNYAYRRFPVKIRNTGNDTVKQMEFEVDINGVTQTATLRDMGLPPYQDAWFDIPVSEYPNAANQNVTATVQTVNGSASVSQPSVSYSFRGPIESASSVFYVELYTDLAGDEITFSVNNREGETLYLKGPFEPNTAVTLKDTVTLTEAGVYALDFGDAWNDGWREGIYSGIQAGYKVKNAAGKLIAQSYNVEGSGVVIFVSIDESVITGVEARPQNPEESRLKVVSILSGLRILNPDNETLSRVEVYGIDGKLLYSRQLNQDTNTDVLLPASGSRLLLVKVSTLRRTRVFKVMTR